MKLDRDNLINKQSNKKTIKLSKFLSLILRHQPETIGFSLDTKGWADVDLLIKLARQPKRQIDRSLLEQIVANNDKKRFAFNRDKTKIRADRGHSIQTQLDKVDGDEEVSQLTSVYSPYRGKVRRVKILGQNERSITEFSDIGYSG